jgi:protein involved in polysaccharide export with SLBB domain
MAANYYVTVEGGVKKPGNYPITRDGTKLSSVIRQAGGLTERVNLNGALVYRTKVGEIDASLIAERERLLSLRASLSFQDTSYYHVESMLRLKEEQVVVDFRGLFARGDSTFDITLRPHDRIVIPEKQYTVYVFGQVVSPGHVLYKEGEGYKHFVERAGGMTSEARRGDVKVIKAGTRAWLDPGETSIEDGDLIWVPKDREFPFSYYVNTYAQIAGIIGTVATVALLINSLK